MKRAINLDAVILSEIVVLLLLPALPHNHRAVDGGDMSNIHKISIACSMYARKNAGIHPDD
jgi:hypothetical protein